LCSGLRCRLRQPCRCFRHSRSSSCCVVVVVGVVVVGVGVGVGGGVLVVVVGVVVVVLLVVSTALRVALRSVAVVSCVPPAGSPIAFAIPSSPTLSSLLHSVPSQAYLAPQQVDQSSPGVYQSSYQKDHYHAPLPRASARYGVGGRTHEGDVRSREMSVGQ